MTAILPVSCMLHRVPMLQGATASISHLALLLAPCEKTYCMLQSQPHDKAHTRLLKLHAHDRFQLATEM